MLPIPFKNTHGPTHPFQLYTPMPCSNPPWEIHDVTKQFSGLPQFLCIGHTRSYRITPIGGSLLESHVRDLGVPVSSFLERHVFVSQMGRDKLAIVVEDM